MAQQSSLRGRQWFSIEDLNLTAAESAFKVLIEADTDRMLGDGAERVPERVAYFQLLTNKLFTVTAKAARSSPVVPAIFLKHWQA